MTALTHTPSHLLMALTPKHTAQWYRKRAEEEFAGKLSQADKVVLESEGHIEAYRDAIKAWAGEIEEWLRDYKAEQVVRKAAIANYNDPPPTPEDKRAYAVWETQQQAIRRDMIRVNDWCDKRLRNLRELATERGIVARLRQRVTVLEGYIRGLLDEQRALSQAERDEAWIIEMFEVLQRDVP